MEAEFPCYVDGVQQGVLQLRRQGLYWQAIATVAQQAPERLLRAYVVLECGEEALGVMVPKDGALRAAKLFPASWFHPEAIIRCEAREDNWASWEGKIQGYPIKDALARMDGAIQEVAVPYDPETPFSLIPLFCFFRLQTIREKAYLVIRLDETGWPIL